MITIHIICGVYTMVVANQNLEIMQFKVGDSVVYPSHGVGRIIQEEVQNVAGTNFSMLVISFDNDRLTVKVPKNRAFKAGLRFLSTDDEFSRAIDILRGKAKITKGMWSKRAQEYEGKINSGNVINIAEVLRDLHRNVDDPSRSYSEKMIYESALKRLAQEYSVAANLNYDEADRKICQILDEGKVANS